MAKYHEGYFMGNKIRVELSHGGGRTAKYTGDPGACFKCGETGHWARYVFHRKYHPISRILISHLENALIKVESEFPQPCTSM